VNQPLLVAVPLLASALVAAWIAVYAWRRSVIPGARAFALLQFSVMAWSLVGVATHLSPSLTGKLFWTNAQYVWVALVPFFWLLFVLVYTGHERLLTLRNVAALSIHPVMLQVLVWANPAGLFRKAVWLESCGGLTIMGNELGPLFWAHAAYSYALLLVASALLLRAHFGSSRIYNRQGVALAVAIIIPWVANLVTVFAADAICHLDLTPFAFTISGVAIALGVFRHGFLDLMPVAQRAVIQSLPTGIVVLDVQGRIVDLNPAAETVLGLSRAEVEGQALGTVLPQYSYLMSRHDDLDGARDEVVIGHGETRRVYDVRFSVLQGRHGKAIGQLFSLQDITERKESQTALSRYADRLRILHQIDEAILNAGSPEEIAGAALGQVQHLFTAQRLSVVALDAACRARALAVRASGRLRQMPLAWVEPATVDAAVFAKTTCVNTIPDGEDGDSLSRRLRADGIRSYLIAPLLVQKRLIGALTFDSTMEGAFSSEHIDVATQVATSLAVGLENARLLAAVQLELAERTQAEEALRQSEASLRQKAEDLSARNAELDAFAHTVAHDLKTPLSLLTGYTSFIAAGEVADDPAQMDWCVRAIGQSARKMHNIIDELLLLASVRKVEDVSRQPLDMGMIVSDVLIRLSDLVDQEHAEVVVPKAWPIAWGNAQWIEEVWANYISNALKYGGTPPRIEIGATVLHDDPPGGSAGMIRFWVRDNGDGLTEEQQARLFIPFERLDQARAKGYGLGLSIVQRIMEKLGGTAGVESAAVPGEGSTFYFVLPQADLPL